MQIKTLQKLGLTDKETQVYLATLELGEASVQKIAKKAKLKRTTAYVMLESLIKKGLVSTVTKGKKRLFAGESPETLLLKLQEKEAETKEQQRELKRLLPELKSIHNVSDIKPRVRFYEGIEGLKTIYETTLEEAKPMFSFTAVIPEIEPSLYKWLEEYYVKKRRKFKVFAKVIVPRTKLAQEYQKHDKEGYRKSVLIPVERFPFSIEINIYGNKVALISYKKKELLGVIIESQEIAKTMRLIFDLSWEKALDYQRGIRPAGTIQAPQTKKVAKTKKN